ncbi:MAG: GtrA family protein [Clostridia bacterium]|nr:GtrA family protein [Clostridia bacterium]
MSEKKKELMRAIKFTLFSVSAGIIQAVSFALLYEVLHGTYWVAYLISLVLSVVWNFTLNRNITFKSASNIPVAMLKVAAFYAVFTPLSTWGGAVLEKSGWNGYVVFVITMLLNFVLEFLYDRFFVFGSSLDTRETKKS